MGGAAKPWNEAGGNLRREFAIAQIVLACCIVSEVTAQRAPDTVRLEELTWVEVKDRIASGATSVIIATAGTEQKGPHMVLGQHRFVLEYTTDKIARALGNALVAPIITYVPEGAWQPPSGYMRWPGTITLPNERFVQLLLNAARSLRAGGFTDVILLGDSGGNQEGMREAAQRLNAEWAGSPARAHFIGDYYAKSEDEGVRYLTRLGLSERDIGEHAGVQATSEMLFVNPAYVRRDRVAAGTPESGVSGDPGKASAEIGRVLVQLKIDNAVAQIRRLVEGRP